MALTEDEVYEDIPTGGRGDRAKLAALTVRKVLVWGRLDAVDCPRSPAACPPSP